MQSRRHWNMEEMNTETAILELRKLAADLSRYGTPLEDCYSEIISGAAGLIEALSRLSETQNQERGDER